MRKLNFDQMENLSGDGCGWSAVGLGLTFAGAFLVTGPIGAGLFAASFIHGSIALAQDCAGQQVMTLEGEASETIFVQ